jgi:methylmalonyl-CoA mutase N-terminal domain/subunit
MGGMIPAIAAGFPQKEIADAAYRYQMQIDEGRKTVVGVNRYVGTEQSRPEILKVGEEMERAQLDRLRQVREQRDEQHVTRALDTLRKAADTDDNLMPLMLDAVRGYASVGEVCQALVPVFGTYRETSVL